MIFNTFTKCLQKIFYKIEFDFCLSKQNSTDLIEITKKISKLTTDEKGTKDLVFVNNVERLSEKLWRMRQMGNDSLVVISDFDRTLTRLKYNGRRCSSTMSLLTTSDFVKEEYRRKSRILNDTYVRLCIIDPNVGEERLKIMKEWFELTAQYITKEDFTLERILKVLELQKNVIFRYGINELVRTIVKNEIPFYILSGGIQDLICPILFTAVEELRNYEKLNVFSNKLFFDDNGFVKGFHSSELIHSFNKAEILKKNNLDFKNKNIILLGDSLGDLLITKNLAHDNEISIGFINHNHTYNYELFVRDYDILIQADGNLTYSIIILKYLLGHDVIPEIGLLKCWNERILKKILKGYNKF